MCEEIGPDLWVPILQDILARLTEPEFKGLLSESRLIALKVLLHDMQASQASKLRACIGGNDMDAVHTQGSENAPSSQPHR